ncbi:MAG: bifunctional folylpolyglutamate synthase/dihydrofolate synthase [Roseibacillus sp.]|nr:bifunctional folylpolyglutamate synthase/dihydrofolate synthase [Roseibacillus sp.]
MNYSEALDWLYSSQLFGIKLGLENPKRLLREYLAYPPRRTRVIHVAGTNGKGSTCAFIESVARATGTRTGLFTSPHLVRYGERIRVSGIEINEDEIASHLTALRELVTEWETHPTFFELSLALAMKYFTERACELVILETGMGGRLDATTAVPADVAVLSPIALDHQQWLGETLGEIAAEKASIIVPRKKVFSSPQLPEARIIIEQVANERRAPLEFVEKPLHGYALGLTGEHQHENAALALAALHSAGITLSYETVKAGLGSTSWPGRFERLESGPGAIAAGLVLDIAHNPAAAAALAATWVRKFGEGKANLIFGAVESKDIAGILEALLPIADRMHFVPVNSPRALPPAELATLLPASFPSVEVHQNLQSAFDVPAALPTLVTGSAFLVGEVKALLDDSPHRPSTQ